MKENSLSNSVSDLKISGFLLETGVSIVEKSSIDALSQRGYGVTEKDIFQITFYEGLYLLDKGLLEVKDQKGHFMNFQSLLQCYERVDENAWVNYLVYRDLRSRGYVVREGFGVGTDFRVYERGTYGQDTALYMVLGTQEGKPLPIDNLAKALRYCQSQKKELILSVMNRRGEIVYYSLSELRV
jgi:tRNA-intron endonuclease, archaea type